MTIQSPTLASQATAELPKLPEPDIIEADFGDGGWTDCSRKQFYSAQHDGYATRTGFTADQMNAHYIAGYEAGMASRAPCQHRIADARNAHVQSGYVCLDCGAVFAAADHEVASRAGNEPVTQAPAQAGEVAPDYSEMSREQLERHAIRMAQLLTNDRAIRFYDKHAFGPLAAPSCLCCGRLPDKVAIKHMELPGVVICQSCRDKALAIAPAAAAEPSEPAQEVAEPDDDLLTGQAQYLIGALMGHGLLARSMPEDQYLKLWDVVKRQLRCVNREGARAASPNPQDSAAPARERAASLVASEPLTQDQVMALLIELNSRCVQSESPSEMFSVIVRAVESAHGISAGEAQS